MTGISIVPARQAQRSNQGQTLFICTLWVPSRPSTKYFIPFRTQFQFLCLHRPASWAGSRAGSLGPAGAIPVLFITEKVEHLVHIKYRCNRCCQDRQRSCRPTKNRVGKKTSLFKRHRSLILFFVLPSKVRYSVTKKEFENVGFWSKIVFDWSVTEAVG